MGLVSGPRLGQGRGAELRQTLGSEMWLFNFRVPSLLSISWFPDWERGGKVVQR